MTAAIPTAGAAVRAYLAALPPDTRRELKRIRAAIRDAAPTAVEAFSYGMPAFALDGETLLWYAGWTRHYSLYPIGPDILRANAAALAGYAISKATVRFPLATPPSTALVRRLVGARVAALDGRKLRAHH